MASELLQGLRDLRDLLEPPQNWIQGAYAGRAPGAGTPGLWGDEPEAVCWCLDGGVRRIGIYPELRANIRVTLTAEAKKRDPFRSGIIHFNDSHTHREVLELIDAAIARVIAEETAKS